MPTSCLPNRETYEGQWKFAGPTIDAALFALQPYLLGELGDTSELAGMVETRSSPSSVTDHTDSILRIRPCMNMMHP